MTERDSSAFRRGGDTMGARVRAFDWAATPLGAIAGWPGALRVCTDLMLASKFASCLFWGPDLIAIYNDGYRTVLGQKPEALGQPMRVTWREAWDGLKPIAEKALAGQSTFIEDFPLQIDRHGHLEDACFTFCYSPVFDEHGEVVGILDTVVETTAKVLEITARKRAEADLLASDELRQSQKLEAIGQLTGGVAHDFNNLLTIISSSVALLRKPDLPEERRQRFIEAISKAVGRGAKLTGQLLAFARRQTLMPSVFDAGHNVKSVMEMIATLVGSRIDIQVLVCAEGCHINADPGQFDTAIVNMVINARDAMDGAGRLGIAVALAPVIPAVRAHPAKAGDYVAIAISDTGTGIAPERFDRIFEPFYTTKAVGHGTGLGLSQVFGFAKQSGGEVQVQSTVGSGSTFTLYLPRAQAVVAAEPAPSNSSPASDEGLGAVVLVVEDNLEVACAVQAALGELGYRTALACSAEEALALIGADAQRYAVVFSDVVMAGMDGIELGRQIRQHHPALPVILSSGYSHVLAQEPDHEFELLPKPYALDELARAMRHAIHGPEAATPAKPSVPVPVLQSLLSEAEAERARLAELESMHVMDTEEETAYNDLTRMAAEICDAPVALLSLVDHDRQWFKAHIGTQLTQTPREHAFCAHAIKDPDHVMVVSDTTLDVRFANNPLVTGDPNIRFYAGAPLVTRAGHALGTVCVLAPAPRDIDPRQMEMLQFLASQIVQRLERRRGDPPPAAAGGT